MTVIKFDASIGASFSSQINVPVIHVFKNYQGGLLFNSSNFSIVYVSISFRLLSYWSMSCIIF